MAIQFAIDGLDALLTYFGEIEEASVNLEPGLRNVGEEMKLRTHDRWMAGGAPDGSKWPVSARALGVGGQTMLQWGKLLASINYTPEGSDLVLFSDDIRMGVHQRGDLITPKHAKMLARPLTPEVAAQYKAGVSIRQQWPDAFVLRSEGGHVYLAQKSGKGALELLFELHYQLQAKKREGVGFSEGDLEMMGETMIKHHHID